VFEYGLQEDLTPNLVFIDGLTRCGKSIFSPLIGTFERCEQIRFFSLIEQLIPAIMTESIELDFCRSLLRTQLNEFAYDMMLSRNANFRKGEQTSIYNHPEPEIYENRLNKPEGDGVISEIRSNERIIPIMTHDMMASMDSLIQLNLNFKMIEIYRHPIDLINSQFQRGWGKRFGNDPRAFTLTVSKMGALYPWYAIGFEDMWESFSELERVVWMTLTLLEKSVTNHKELTDKQNLLSIRFEDLVTTPNPVIAKITQFLRTQETKNTWEVLEKSNIPRMIDKGKRISTFKHINKSIRPDLRKSLEQTVNNYESNCYGVPFQ